jgi:DNA-binding transcriptional LysR family regulator
MRITLAQLSAFFWIARLGSVHAAAEQLGLAQPTVSLRLRDLERAVGRPLFVRAGRGLRLTPEGRLALGHAAIAMGEVARIQDLGESAAEVRGVVRVGMQETFALACLAPLLRLLSERHPGLQPELVISTSEELERAVVARSLDIAFVSNPTGDPRLAELPLGVQEAAWASPVEWQLPDPLRPADLRTFPILSTPHPSPMHRQIISWFKAAGIEPLRLGLCSSVTVIAHLAASGAAASFLPRRMIASALEGGQLRLHTARPAVESSRVAAVWLAALHRSVTPAVLRCAIEVLAGIDFLEPASELTDLPENLRPPAA